MITQEHRNLLDFLLDTVIPHMREMRFVEDEEDLKPNGPQVFFDLWMDDDSDRAQCGTYACLGGWAAKFYVEEAEGIEPMAEPMQYVPMFERAIWQIRAHVNPSVHKDVFSGSFEFCPDGTAREEFEARAKYLEELRDAIRLQSE